MSILIEEKTDLELKMDVLSELQYEPSVKVTDIGILVKDGTVTLNGSVNSYSEKLEAVRAAKRVNGVNAIADNIEIKPTDFLRPVTDAEIAAAALHHINWFTTIPEGSVQVTVGDGWITLEGKVEWQYLKIAAGHFLPHLSGVKGVTNSISIVPRLMATAVEMDIKSAFKRNALLEANEIHVETLGSKVILTGRVRNYAELDEAERVTWSAKGVLSVDNELTVAFSFAA